MSSWRGERSFSEQQPAHNNVTLKASCHRAWRSRRGDLRKKVCLFDVKTGITAKAKKKTFLKLFCRLETWVGRLKFKDECSLHVHPIPDSILIMERYERQIKNPFPFVCMWLSATRNISCRHTAMCVCSWAEHPRWTAGQKTCFFAFKSSFKSFENERSLMPETLTHTNWINWWEVKRHATKVSEISKEGCGRRSVSTFAPCSL